MVKKIIRVEGLFVFLVSLYIYQTIGASWVLFIFLWFVPDISMIAYLINEKWGAISYDLAHTYIVSVSMILCGIFCNTPLITSIGIIHASHCGLDRSIGYGLKYRSGFNHTHIQKL